MAKLNGHISVVVDETTGESESISEENSETESVFEDRYFLNESLIEEDDVAPTYILQPREISKNIDLMRTVAILLEGKLKQPQVKVPDIEKVRELYSDIHRFPEAFQKFSHIVHQIQYLNVTPDWENSAELQNSSLALNDDYNYGSFITKVFSSTFSRSSLSTATPFDCRRKVMLNLLNNVEKVFGRYQGIQNMLEDRLKKYNKSISKLHDRNENNMGNGTALDLDIEEDNNDDSQVPLLSAKTSTSNRYSYNRLLQRFKIMMEVLQKTRRSALDVQDGIDVLRDLIRWDYKQAISSISLSSASGQYGSTSNGNTNSSQAKRGEGMRIQNEVDLETCHSETTRILPNIQHQNESQPQNTQINHRNSTRETKNRKLLIFLVVMISIVLILSIITAALSFLKFSY